ncbi:MAG: hypothetical protein ACKOA8_04295 [Deltaproteobacteria bacterium]
MGHSVFTLIILFNFLIFTQLSAEPKSDHLAGESKLQRHGQALGKGSPELEAVREKIHKMVAIVDGNEKNKAAIQTNETIFLRPRNELAEESAKILLQSLETGKVTSALTDFLVGNEAYTDSEHKEIFSNEEGENLFAKIKDKNEKTIAAFEYTQARKLLRLKLLKEVVEMLKKSSDPRALLLAEAIKRVIPASQKSYDEASHRINQEQLDRPICFTCGEPVSADPEYHFYTAMSEAAEAVTKQLNLIPTSKGEQIQTPYFDRERTFYTYDGKTMHELQDEKGIKHEIGVNNGTVTYSFNGEPARNLDTSKHVEKSLSQLRVDFLNSGGKPQVISTNASSKQNTASSGNPNRNSTSGSEVVNTFLNTYRGQNMAQLFPRADDMAKTLGLVNEKGESYWEHKDAHWDGTQEFGLRIRWDLIRNAPLEERNRIVSILSTIKNGQISDWKVVNGQRGYCPWCNLRNDPTSLRELNELKGN